jgi:hypothetical protein
MVNLIKDGNNGHRNALIYQKETKQFYYIEPYGTETGNIYLPDEKFKPFWEDFTKSDTFPTEADKSKLPNFVFGEEKGLQPKVQEQRYKRPDEKRMRQGFCVTVSLFVVKLFELNHTRIKGIEDFRKMIDIFIAISTLTGKIASIVQAFNVRIMRTFLTLVNLESIPVYSRRTKKSISTGKIHTEDGRAERQTSSNSQRIPIIQQTQTQGRGSDQQLQLQRRLDNCLKPNWMSLFVDMDVKKKKRIKEVIKSILPSLKHFTVTYNLKRLDEILRKEGISIINIPRRKCLSDLFKKYLENFEI